MLPCCCATPARIAAEVTLWARFTSSERVASERAGWESTGRPSVGGGSVDSLVRSRERSGPLGIERSLRSGDCRVCVSLPLALVFLCCLPLGFDAEGFGKSDMSIVLCREGVDSCGRSHKKSNHLAAARGERPRAPTKAAPVWRLPKRFFCFGLSGK